MPETCGCGHPREKHYEYMGALNRQHLMCHDNECECREYVKKEAEDA